MSEERCPSCGYTKEDAQFHMDHRFCKNAGNAPWEKKAESVGEPPRAEPPYSALICVGCKTRHDVNQRICGKCGGMTFEKVFEAGSRPSAPAPTREGLCEDCGKEYPTPWFVSNDLWNKVVELSTNPKNFLCMHCFVKRADKVIRCTGWEIVPENRPSAPTIRKNRSTPESAAHWDFVEETAKKVDAMPEWKQNAISSAPAPSGEPRKTEIVYFSGCACGGTVYSPGPERCPTHGNPRIESSPVDLQQEAEKWLADSVINEGLVNCGDPEFRESMVTILAAFAAHLREGR